MDMHIIYNCLFFKWYNQMGFVASLGKRTALAVEYSAVIIERVDRANVTNAFIIVF